MKRIISRTTSHDGRPRPVARIGAAAARLRWFMCLVVVLVSARSAAATEVDYEPYAPSAAEQISAPLFVVIAYLTIWLVLILFLASVWLRQRRVVRELHDLQRRLGD